MSGRYLRPSFFIIGERKCGTTSFYRYLIEHPDILPCRQKEPQFFSQSGWRRVLKFYKYLALFPPKSGLAPVYLDWPILTEDGEIKETVLKFEREKNHHYITGEASANMLATVKPVILKKRFPEAKIFVLLRDPVDRAFSHYRMLQRFRKEGRKLPVELTTFEADVQKEIGQIERGERSYFIEQGIYVAKLKSWFDVFGKHQIQIIVTEHLSDPGMRRSLVSEAFLFLGLKPFPIEPLLKEQFNTSPKAVMSTEVRKMLTDFYLPYNNRLEQLLGIKTSWNP